MSDFADQFPLFVRTEADIRADLDARAVAGLTTDDPDWVDTRSGSPFYLATQGTVTKFSEAYSRLNEVLAAAILDTSWGDALDAIAASYSESRAAAIAATGTATFVGDPGTIIGSGAQLSPPQTDPDIDPPLFETTAGGTIPAAVAPATLGVLTLAIQAVDEGADGNVIAGAITVPVGSMPGVSAVSNIDPTADGEDVETDEHLKTKLKAKMQGSSGGNIGWYTNQALNYPGVGYVTVVPAWNGPGTVGLIIEDRNKQPVSTTVTNGLQTALDPVPGQGEGLANIDHVVTVMTPAQYLVSVAATVQFETGYGLDAGAGLIATRQAITNQLQSYINGLQSGDDVIYNHVLAQFFKVRGVKNVTGFTLNGGTADIAIATSPPQVAELNMVTLS